MAIIQFCTDYESLIQKVFIITIYINLNITKIVLAIFQCFRNQMPAFYHMK